MLLKEAFRTSIDMVAAGPRANLMQVKDNIAEEGFVTSAEEHEPPPILLIDIRLIFAYNVFVDGCALTRLVLKAVE
jgi:hypothetical protein